MALPVDLEGILQRQARSWEMRQRMADEGGEKARDALAHLSEGPWVTVSRQLGSAGHEVARTVAERFGWQVFDRQILSGCATQTDTVEQILSRLDERAIGAFDDYLAQLMVPRDPGQTTFLKEMMRVIWGIARQGNAIILGRGANWILKSRFGLRLRVVAPLELRAQNLAEDRDCSVSEALQLARDHDGQQAAFIRQVYARDIDDPLGYDLILNVSSVDVKTAGTVAVAALAAKLGVGK
ncbi:MAG: cytidylate kinase-like family protein [bacterium]|nr:cytidylate kinase-like family protein [bacterium]